LKRHNCDLCAEVPDDTQSALGCLCDIAHRTPGRSGPTRHGYETAGMAAWNAAASAGVCGEVEQRAEGVRVDLLCCGARWAYRSAEAAL